MRTLVNQDVFFVAENHLIAFILKKERIDPIKICMVPISISLIFIWTVDFPE